MHSDGNGLSSGTFCVGYRFEVLLKLLRSIKERVCKRWSFWVSLTEKLSLFTPSGAVFLVSVCFFNCDYFPLFLSPMK